jgi:hypothetical protein
MRHVPAEMAARLKSGAATLCHAWIVSRADGMRLGFTDHDGPLWVEGVRCEASAGWDAGASEGGLGGAPSELSAGGATLDAEAVRAGLWDGARVELWRVDWTATEMRVRLWVGTLERLRLDGERMTADLAGPLARLETVVGRTYGRGCDAVLGDARCGLESAGRLCDGRWETCRDTFNNVLNFRGFPDIPGDDFLLAHPGAGERHDGGRRR